MARNSNHIKADALVEAEIKNDVLVTVGGAHFSSIVIDDSNWLKPDVVKTLEKSRGRA